MSANINYASTVLSGNATVVTADTSRTAPTTFVKLIESSGGTGGTANAASGAQIERIVLTPVGTTIQSVIRLFLYDGTNYHLRYELQLSPQTVSGTVAVASQTFEAVDNPNMFPMLLPAGWALRATINDTQSGGGVNISAEGGGF